MSEVVKEINVTYQKYNNYVQDSIDFFKSLNITEDLYVDTVISNQKFQTSLSNKLNADLAGKIIERPNFNYRNPKWNRAYSDVSVLGEYKEISIKNRVALNGIRFKPDCYKNVSKGNRKGDSLCGSIDHILTQLQEESGNVSNVIQYVPLIEILNRVKKLFTDPPYQNREYNKAADNLERIAFIIKQLLKINNYNGHPELHTNTNKDSKNGNRCVDCGGSFNQSGCYNLYIFGGETTENNPKITTNAIFGLTPLYSVETRFTEKNKWEDIKERGSEINEDNITTQFTKFGNITDYLRIIVHEIFTSTSSSWSWKEPEPANLVEKFIDILNIFNDYGYDLKNQPTGISNISTMKEIKGLTTIQIIDKLKAFTPTEVKKAKEEKKRQEEKEKKRQQEEKRKKMEEENKALRKELEKLKADAMKAGKATDGAKVNSNNNHTASSEPTASSANSGNPQQGNPQQAQPSPKQGPKQQDLNLKKTKCQIKQAINAFFRSLSCTNEDVPQDKLCWNKAVGQYNNIEKSEGVMFIITKMDDLIKKLQDISYKDTENNNKKTTLKDIEQKDLTTVKKLKVLQMILLEYFKGVDYDDHVKAWKEQFEKWEKLQSDRNKTYWSGRGALQKSIEKHTNPNPPQSCGLKLDNIQLRF